jgi:hypothetical protein
MCTCIGGLAGKDSNLPFKTIVLFQRLMSLSIKKLNSNSVLASTTPPQIPIQIQRRGRR